MISGWTRPRKIFSLGRNKENIIKKLYSTWWDFKLGGELNWFTDLNYVICGRIVQEALKMEDENKWKRLDLHLLACLA